MPRTKKVPPLDPKERKFVEHYLETWDPEEAARRAGYPNWHEKASELLGNNVIVEAIKAGEKEPDKHCQACETKLNRRANDSGGPESLSVFKRRKYCNDKCAQHRNRPDGWIKNHSEARKHKKDECESCGIKESLHAHHIDGDPKNNTRKNIQTLCTWCHHFIHAIMKRLGLDIPGKLPRLNHHVN